MITKHIFYITEFARFARTTRDTLIHYENYGLLVPERGVNNYRYYSHSQLATVNLIRTCQALGMSLSEIKGFIDERTPSQIYDLLNQKINDIDEKIAEWQQARILLRGLTTTIQSVLDVDENAITVQYLPEQPIILGEVNDYSNYRDDYDALYSFYHSISKKYPEIDMNYSVWGTFSEERIKRRDWQWPDRYYFNNPDGLDRRPAASYVIGYTRGGYGQSASLYEQLMDYIDANGYEICGPAFEEYPLNEICISDDSNYLMRVMITVNKK